MKVVLQIALFEVEEQPLDCVTEHAEQENLSLSVQERELSEVFRVCACPTYDEIF